MHVSFAFPGFESLDNPLGGGGDVKKKKPLKFLISAFIIKLRNLLH